MSKEFERELLRRSALDQEMRNRFNNTRDMSDWDENVDKENTDFLKSHVSKMGWPPISEIGEEASRAAWLLVQHADHMTDFQEHCLGLMKALPESEVSPSNIAYLEDRVRVAQGKPQLYGTQFHQKGDILSPHPIEDKAHLEDRRALMGLESFESNKQRLLQQYGYPN